MKSLEQRLESSVKRTDEVVQGKRDTRITHLSPLDVSLVLTVCSPAAIGSRSIHSRHRHLSIPNEVVREEFRNKGVEVVVERYKVRLVKS